MYKLAVTVLALALTSNHIDAQTGTLRGKQNGKSNRDLKMGDMFGGLLGGEGGGLGDLLGDGGLGGIGDLLGDGGLGEGGGLGDLLGDGGLGSIGDLLGDGGLGDLLGDGGLGDLLGDGDGLGVIGQILEAIGSGEGEGGGLSDVIQILMEVMNQLSGQFGAGSIMQDMILGWLNEIEFEPKDCPSTEPPLPACAYNPAGDEGIWVCRTLANPFTQQNHSLTMCVYENHTLAADECGYCNEFTPSICTCPCDDGAGVSVTVTPELPMLPDANVTFDVCMDPKIAVSAVSNMPWLSCSTSCQR
jgi:hypothetical protein